METETPAGSDVQHEATPEAQSTPMPSPKLASEATPGDTAEPTPMDIALLPTEPLPPLLIGGRIEGTLTEAGATGRIALPDGRSIHIDGQELAGDPSGDPASLATLEVGMPVSAFVVRIDSSGEVWASRSKGSAALLLLLNARDHDDSVEGRVAAQGPRGLEINLGGGLFAICPVAEVGDDVDNPGHLVGQTLQFKVKEANAREVVLSRKAALSKLTTAEVEKRAEEAAEVRRMLRPGNILHGRIARLREFGAFVELGGGVEGLIHLSELSHERIHSPKEAVSVGQPVEVQVLKVDYDQQKGERISLSLKALSKTAWDKAVTDLKEGETRTGKVLRVEPFGAFVELLPGVTGLIHVTALGTKRRILPTEVLKAGDEIDVEILAIDNEKHRVSLKRVLGEAELLAKKTAQLALREEKRAEARAKREALRQKPHERLKAGDIVDAAVDRIEPYGFFLQIKGGGRGMVHVSEMGPTPEGVDPGLPLPEQFPKGTKVRVAVLEIDAEHRIRLSRLAVPEMEKGSTPETYLKHKIQHELEEKLLRSAERPTPSRTGRETNRSTPRRAGAPRGENSPHGGGAGRGAGASSRPRQERPEHGGGPASLPARGLPSVKSTGLGTLGDLLKIKLQQRKP